MKVNAELYDLLKEHETGMFLRKDKVIGFVHIPFSALDDFVNVVGEDWFVEGGMEVQLFRDSVCIDINDIIEGDGSSLLNYIRCFDEYEINRFKKELEAMNKIV